MTTAFALHPWVPVPMIIAILGCIILFFKLAIKSGEPLKFFKEDGHGSFFTIDKVTLFKYNI